MSKAEGVSCCTDSVDEAGSGGDDEDSEVAFAAGFGFESEVCGGDAGVFELGGCGEDAGAVCEGGCCVCGVL